MSVIYTPRKPDIDARMLIFPGVILTALLILFMRLWYFQVVKAPELVERAEASRSIQVTQPAPRGLIYDRHHQLIAGVKPEFVITAVPGQVKKHPEVIDRVAAILGLKPARLWTKVKEAQSHPDLFAPIYVGAAIESGIKIAETRDDLPGIGVELQPMRYYPDSKSFTHVLGYVWAPSKDDVERFKKLKKKPADYVGRAGIERAFEEMLMGQAGTDEREVDAKRRSVRSLGGSAAIPGNQLILSLDAELQKRATAYMAENHYVGAVVALDPTTGEILCLVSSPTFDQNLFTGGISDTDWKQLTGDEEKPMLDRAIHSSYGPGSTFKILTSLAAYRKGLFDTDRKFFCAGGVKVGGNFVKCLSFHGAIGYYEAMAKSCNSYFCQLGREVGPQALHDAAEEAGLGQQLGIEIGGESKGLVPSPTREFKKKHGSEGSWYAGDTLNFAIGQGFVRATPLQLANLAAMVANDGVQYKPRLLHAIRSSDGKGTEELVKPEVLHKVQASTEFWADLKKALVGVVDHGTAQKGKIPNVTFAGKTGSVEYGKDKKGKTHAVFVGFAPVEAPKIAICVLIEGVGHGGDFAAKPASDIVAAYLSEGKAKSLPAGAPSAGTSSGLEKASASPSATVALPPSPITR